jgi:hypothetical protein
MRRGLWFFAGAGAGIYAVVRGRRAAEAFTADGLKDRLKGVGVGARMFREEVSQGKAERETELRERLGLVPHGRPELAGPGTRGFPPGSTNENSSNDEEEGST